jgi:hypothetical protein
MLWKRFLYGMSIPHEPLRPTFRNTIDEGTFEIEKLVTRAVSVDDNWRHLTPKLHHNQLVVAHYKVLEMSLLPGGKYLVASMKDSRAYRYFLTVFAIEHANTKDGCRALARYELDVKAYNIQAKYMKYRGVQGVMISFLQRYLKPGSTSATFGYASFFVTSNVVLIC